MRSKPEDGQIMYVIINEKKEFATIGIPGSSGDFRILPAFITRKDARIALKCLPYKGKICKVVARMRMVPK